MNTPLIVYDEENAELLKQAGELAGGVDATLTVVSLMTADEFREARETLDVVAQEEHTSYSDSVVIDAAKRQAKETLEEVLSDVDVEWVVVGARVGDGESEADRILEVANTNDVDHVFITGQKRSPTGKAVFGDRVQSVILNFDGPVTSLLA